jgi:adenosylmethionine-8-amino-7-oxononanoate aminotransferase
MDYVPAFQMASKETFRLANRITQYAPTDLGKVFFVNSGSEAVDTALKMAIAYHRARGESSRTRMIGRERAYHGGCVGGISVGGIPTNRKMFSPMMMPGVDHLQHTLNLSQMAFSRGQPTWGAHLADDLERLVLLHDASNIAAVILEPVQGSTGVIVPPVGYLEKIREIFPNRSRAAINNHVFVLRKRRRDAENPPQEYSKQCPSCGNKQVYSTKEDLNEETSNNSQYLSNNNQSNKIFNNCNK